MTQRTAGQSVLDNLSTRLKKWREALEPIRRLMRDFPDDAKFVQQHLADRGWYLPGGELSIGAFSQLRRMIDDAEYAEIESVVEDHAKSRIQSLLDRLKADYPRRFPILRDALDAHSAGKYTLSIPAILAQADGLCHDLFEVSLFGKKEGRPRTKRALDQKLGKYTVLNQVWPLEQINNALLNPLREESSLIANTQDVQSRRHADSAYGPLNRHGVLHGLDVDYASEANSLRAILLVDYILEARQILLKHEERVGELKRTVDDLGGQGPAGAGRASDNTATAWGPTPPEVDPPPKSN